MKAALVTGSAGFVGRHMTAELRARGYMVTTCDPAHPETPDADALNIFRMGNSRVFDLVVHCAAVSPHRAAIDGVPLNLMRNLLLDASLLDWALRTGQRRVVYLSSSAAYPVGFQDGTSRHRLKESDLDPELLLADADLRTTETVAGLLPDAAYGWTKLTGEKMVSAAQKTGLPIHVVRPFSGYGEDQTANFPFGAFIDRARRREDPFTIWGNGEQVRDWVHIDDVVNGILALVEADVREPVNLCTGRGVSMKELAHLVCREVNYTPEIKLKPDAPAGVMYRVGDPGLFHSVYKPQVTLEEGVRRALA